MVARIRTSTTSDGASACTPRSVGRNRPTGLVWCLRTDCRASNRNPRRVDENLEDHGGVVFGADDRLLSGFVPGSARVGQLAEVVAQRVEGPLTLGAFEAA